MKVKLYYNITFKKLAKQFRYIPMYVNIFVHICILILLIFQLHSIEVMCYIPMSYYKYLWTHLLKILMKFHEMKLLDLKTYSHSCINVFQQEERGSKSYGSLAPGLRTWPPCATSSQAPRTLLAMGKALHAHTNTRHSHRFYHSCWQKVTCHFNN